MVIGTLVAHHVRMNIGIEILQYDGSVFSIQQDLLNTIMPGLLPLLLTLGCYALIKKGWTAIRVLLLIVAVGVVGSLAGILG
jgi:PTS system mannose-specific IID component